MRHAGGYSYEEDYDLDKCVSCGVKMSNLNEPTCSLECEEKREEKERKMSKRDEQLVEETTQATERDKRIDEILLYLRKQGHTSLDLIDELERLIHKKHLNQEHKLPISSSKW